MVRGFLRRESLLELAVAFGSHTALGVVLILAVIGGELAGRADGRGSLDVFGTLLDDIGNLVVFAKPACSGRLEARCLLSWMPSTSQ